MYELLHEVLLLCYNLIIFRCTMLCRELCTLFSFVEMESVLDKVSMVSLDKDSTETSRMVELIYFKVENAKCYDPNEELKLNKVISAVGVEKFHDKIRTLASFYVDEKGRDRVSALN